MLFRKAYRTLGQLMVLEGRLPEADLIFFLQHWEIGVLLETRSVTLVTKAIRRKKLKSIIEEMNFEELNFGVPTPLNKGIEETMNDTTTENIVRGTPVCSGIATGTARVVTSFQQASSIQNGDILITYCTDVGWTPYFPLLAGVVTEIGGLISHGAVVAREYGLPCVVGAKGATSKFKSGDKIIINGKEGYIKKL
ncbi:putative phosphoenolpyruvate synthase [Armadillidium nasatum]|uniref:Putative phosphoenolpyruvate synthase n=1 Tax=Armadillidium nasatum TaxID=96803 RepID=A0A5N5T993_9CRUS|nr:putative phosphoenolpyruvate synthase [Armadillidium nasatum]